MEERAVIDRIEDGQLAVLLVGESEREMHVPGSQLPAGAKAGSWLRVELAEGRITRMEVDEAAKAEADARIADKLRQLRQRGRRA